MQRVSAGSRLNNDTDAPLWPQIVHIEHAPFGNNAWLVVGLAKHIIVTTHKSVRHVILGAIRHEIGSHAHAVCLGAENPDIGDCVQRL